MLNNINDLIRDTRIKKGLSMQKLADLSGVSKRTIVYWERQGREISIQNADKVCKVLGIKYVIGAEAQETN